MPESSYTKLKKYLTKTVILMLLVVGASWLAVLTEIWFLIPVIIIYSIWIIIRLYRIIVLRNVKGK